MTLSPGDFERHVEELLRTSGLGLEEFRVLRREKLHGNDGVYEIDVSARFRALGAEFLVLVECKHHKSPIKRELVQVLYDRLRSVGAHKGMMFATTTFQRGAAEYAQVHGIALVQVADGLTSYQTKSVGPQPPLPPWVPPYVGWVRSISAEGNESFALLSKDRPEFLLDAFRGGAA